jgi:uncharacterized 2Fe-2S/4Fe-4S cluster protein (DUF4445 family)
MSRQWSSSPRNTVGTNRIQNRETDIKASQKKAAAPRDGHREPLPVADYVMGDYLIEFQPIGRRGPCPSGETFLDCARRLGVEIASLCGGSGKCNSCKIRVMQGALSELTPAQQAAFSKAELAGGWRLACQAYPLSDCRVEVPPESLKAQQRLQIEGQKIDILIDPPLKTVACKLEPPSLERPVADAENLLEKIGGLRPKHVDIHVLRDLSLRLREWNWNLKAHVRNRELVAISPPGSRVLGLAVDLGSTKIAGYLVDLETGENLASRGIMNPQISYGEDIITRIDFVIQSPDGQSLMADSVREALMKLAQDLCAEAGAETGDILEAVIVGNTAMHHLMLGLPVLQLARSPFVPATCGAINVKSEAIGLNFAPGAYVYFAPIIAGFVGADHLAALMATAEAWAHANVIVIDIGTNTEISLIARGKITSVSCASGPAFEGYHIKSGVRASPGAIEKIYVGKEDTRYETIGDAKPVGICGSGILDGVSQLFMAGVLDSGGRMQKGSHPHLVEKNGRLEFVLVPQKARRRGSQISITQKDVREVQLGKAAIQAALQILTQQEGISETEIEKIVIAGAFGSYLNISNAQAMGMLPSLPLNRFQQVGNAAGIGAQHLLLSSAKREAVEDLPSRIKYLELGGTPQFSKAFTNACLLGPFRLHSNARGK